MQTYNIIVNGQPPELPESGWGIDFVALAALRDAFSTDLMALTAYDTVSAPDDWDVTMGAPPASFDTDGDGATDDVDADPNNPDIQNEIVVNGIRQDIVNDQERAAERLYYALNGRFANIEFLPDGRAVYITTTNPTEDQLRYKHNLDEAKSDLWFLDSDDKPHTSSLRVAQILTDADIDVVSMNLNLTDLYVAFDDLLSAGAVNNTASGFTDWIWETYLGGNPFI